MYLPVAHAEGKFVTRDAAVLDELDAAGQLVLRYVSQRNGERTGRLSRQSQRLAGPTWPGCATPSGRVLGLMPHPERHIDPTQHPRWTRGEAGRGGRRPAGFLNAVGYFR